MTLSNVARCGEVRRFGTGLHARAWQCRWQDPHPLGEQQPHDFGIDAEVYGRDLDRQRPEWLAANLRDAAARSRHDQRRIEELTGYAAQLATLLANVVHGGVTPVSAATGAWVRDYAPTAASLLDAAIGSAWHR